MEPTVGDLFLASQIEQQAKKKDEQKNVIYIENDDVFESIDDTPTYNDVQRINSESN